MKEMMSKKGRPYDISTFDAGATFRSYGVGFADREGREVCPSPLPAWPLTVAVRTWGCLGSGRTVT